MYKYIIYINKLNNTVFKIKSEKITKLKLSKTLI